MAITAIEMTGPKACLFAHITPKENVLLGVREDKHRSGIVLSHDQFVNSEEIKLPESFLKKIERSGLEGRLEQMMVYLKKLMVK